MDFIRHYLSAIGIDDEYTPQLLANIEKLRGIPLWNALTDHFSTTDHLGSSEHYLGMAAEKDVAKVTDAELDAEINRVRERNGRTVFRTLCIKK